MFRSGDHTCALYETEAEQLAVASNYEADRMQQAERRLYARAVVQSPLTGAELPYPNRIHYIRSL